MTIENQLKQLILSKYKSLRAFTIELNIPYSTIDTMLKRGINGTAVTTVLKVCKALDIDADELSEGKIAPRAIANFNYLDEEETKIISTYRQLDPHGKEMITTVLNKELERIQIQSNYSIHSKENTSSNSQQATQSVDKYNTEFADMSIDELEEEYKKIISNSASKTNSTRLNTIDVFENQKQAK